MADESNSKSGKLLAVLAASIILFSAAFFIISSEYESVHSVSYIDDSDSISPSGYVVNNIPITAPQVAAQAFGIKQSANVSLLFVMLTISFFIISAMYIKQRNPNIISLVAKQRNAPDRLIKFVRHSMHSGRTKAEVKRELTAVGWKKELIEDALRRY